MVAIMTSRFPTDASGEILEVVLAALRETRPKRKAGIKKPITVEWLTERMPLNSPAEIQAFAYVGEYRLFAVEMRYFAMLQHGENMPRISWAFGEDDDDIDPLAGGPAPSFAVAMLRAEQAMRVFFGIDN
ncbi:MAG: hypothetical protein EON55_10125 [Alphaproteobacteria bacterium]|nr:MAG: hypothetical protein EON55_10125 [Alphaproteobacteria bacterium]